MKPDWLQSLDTAGFPQWWEAHGKALAQQHFRNLNQPHELETAVRHAELVANMAFIAGLDFMGELWNRYAEANK